MNILVLGFYHQFNFGDDIFEYIISKHIKTQISNTLETRCNLTFMEISELSKKCIYPSYSVIFIGGGEVVNNYFLSCKNLQILQDYYSDTPIIFIGVGVQYMSCLYKLDIGDHFYIRNKNDYKIVRERYGDEYVTYLPDIAFLLYKENAFKPIKCKNEIKKIALCFPPGISDILIINIIKLLKNSIKNAHIVFIPFDTSNDIKNSDLLKYKNIDTNVDILEVYSNQDSLETRIKKMMAAFSGMDLIFASRFHSVILSVLTNTPFISIYNQAKIENLIPEMNQIKSLFIKMERIPKVIENVQNALDIIQKNPTQIKNKLEDILDSFLLYFPEELNFEFYKRQVPPRIITFTQCQKLTRETIVNILTITSKLNHNNINKLIKGGNIGGIIGSDNSPSNKKKITEEILWSITGDPFAPYYYGLYDDLFLGNIVDKIDWIIKDYNLRYKYSSSDKSNIINKNFQEIHRSGWQYIINSVSSNAVDNLIIDTYIDKTFHWNCEFYLQKGIIPYKTKWIGFIHHTYSDYNNNFNCLELFENKIFLKSLDSCKCLIVMTEYLARQIRESLSKCNRECVNVQVMYHPSEQTLINFTFKGFEENKFKRLVHIGSWLRDVFSIYALTLPNNSFISQKSILVNKNSDNYIIDECFIDDMFNNTQCTVHQCLDMSKIAFQNMAIKGMYNHLMNLYSSVERINHVTNEEYDNLICDNIVFVNYMDASATNTLIECIMRNTPIIVNKIEPIVEILGEDYPLYYRNENLNDVTELLKQENLYKINQAYQYLLEMDKTRFTIEFFLECFQKIITDTC